MKPIEEYKKEHGLSVRALARIAGLDAALVWRHLQGKPMGFASATKYADALGIPLDEIIANCKIV